MNGFDTDNFFVSFFSILLLSMTIETREVCDKQPRQLPKRPKVKEDNVFSYFL